MGLGGVVGKERDREREVEREAHFILGDVKSHGDGRSDAAFSILETQKERREDGKMRMRHKERERKREQERYFF